MPEIRHIPFDERQQDEQARAVADRYGVRPDLRDAPDNPPVDDEDVERGREKLERVIAK
jgi:hypothetical protein